MAHFAKLNSNNEVEKITRISNDLVTPYGTVGSQDRVNLNIEQWINRAFKGRYKQCSYNANFRGVYPGKGDTHNEEQDQFVTLAPFDSWSYNYTEHRWKAPITHPNITQFDTFYPDDVVKLNVAEDNEIYYNNVEWDDVQQLFFGWKHISGVKPDPVILKKCTWNGTAWTETEETKEV